MYTIAYVDRTNVTLALTPKVSTMMKDLFMDDQMKGQAVGLFFFGYVLLQIPCGHWATRWSARKVISLCWSAGASARSPAAWRALSDNLRAVRGVARAVSFPPCGGLPANWFPPCSERARANAYWESLPTHGRGCLCSARARCWTTRVGVCRQPL